MFAVICSYCRPKDAEIKKIQKLQRGQAAAHGIYGRAAPAVEDRVPGEPLYLGAAAALSRPGTQAQRVSDKNLVSEQAGQDKKGQWLQERPGATADGAGTLQPFNHNHPAGQRGQRLMSQAVSGTLHITNRWKNLGSRANQTDSIHSHRYFRTGNTRENNRLSTQTKDYHGKSVLSNAAHVQLQVLPNLGEQTSPAAIILI